jgi:hypothetical protein
MKRLLFIAFGLVLAAACSRQPNALNVPTGSQVTVLKKDGGTVAGKLVDARSDRVVVQLANGDRAVVQRTNIRSISADALAPADATGTTGVSGDPRYSEVTLPAGTELPVVLETAVGSDISHVEQPVTGRLSQPVVIRGVTALPAGTQVFGNVTAATRPGRVEGRGLVSMRFSQVDTPGAGTTRISTTTVSREAPATKGKDAIEVLGPAAGAAVIGRLIGGKTAAREGALIGGGAGAAYVLSTPGRDVRVGKGATVMVRLTAPVTFRVR